LILYRKCRIQVLQYLVAFGGLIFQNELVDNHSRVSLLRSRATLAVSFPPSGFHSRWLLLKWRRTLDRVLMV